MMPDWFNIIAICVVVLAMVGIVTVYIGVFRKSETTMTAGFLAMGVPVIGFVLLFAVYSLIGMLT